MLQLYRSLRRKARYACSQQEQLFRFQINPNPELWGKGLMFDPAFDRQVLQSIFPSSIHGFIENDIPFDPNRCSSIHLMERKQRLFGNYMPKLSESEEELKQKEENQNNNNLESFRTDSNTTVGNYPISDDQKVIADEQQITTKISRDPTLGDSVLAENMRISEYDTDFFVMMM